jgi:hypothetical protein
VPQPLSYFCLQNWSLKPAFWSNQCMLMIIDHFGRLYLLVLPKIRYCAKIISSFNRYLILVPSLEQHKTPNNACTRSPTKSVGAVVVGLQLRCVRTPFGQSSSFRGFKFFLLSSRIQTRPPASNASCGLTQHVLHVQISRNC